MVLNASELSLHAILTVSYWKSWQSKNEYPHFFYNPKQRKSMNQHIPKLDETIPPSKIVRWHIEWINYRTNYLSISLLGRFFPPPPLQDLPKTPQTICCGWSRSYWQEGEISVLETEFTGIHWADSLETMIEVFRIPSRFEVWECIRGDRNRIQWNPRHWIFAWKCDKRAENPRFGLKMWWGGRNRVRWNLQSWTIARRKKRFAPNPRNEFASVNGVLNPLSLIIVWKCDRGAQNPRVGL